MSRPNLLTFLLPTFAILGSVDARADSCTTAKNEIATDRPDVTNSSLVVPVGSLQSENGVNFSARDGRRIVVAGVRVSTVHQMSSNRPTLV